MEKRLAILLTAGGSILAVASVPFLDVAEVRQWFPVFLIAGSVLLWKGIKKYRNA